MKLSPAQRRALEAARDFGHAHHYAFPSNPRGSMPHAWSYSRYAALNRLVSQGLLEADSYALTDTGRALVGAARP